MREEGRAVGNGERKKIDNLFVSDRALEAGFIPTPREMQRGKPRSVAKT